MVNYLLVCLDDAASRVRKEKIMRTETDTLGSRRLPDDALYGLQTLRASENFALDERRVNPLLIHNIILVKKAAALTYRSLKLMEEEKADAIISACDYALTGAADRAFITHPLQGGAGTSTNMNVNEVIANLALKELGQPLGRYDIIHPLDDVNRGQSTNDVYPTALRISAVTLIRKLSQNCADLQTALQEKEHEYENIRKLGRTELMDAMPVTLGQEFGAYAQAVSRDRWRIYKAEERLRQINLGGTAVGTGNNANRRYALKVVEVLRDLTDIGLARAEYPMDMTQNNDVFVEVSGLMKALAATLMKISTDLRLMSSGPKGGLGEIHLAPLQMGSTIMPGKVNPVIPEMVTQIAMKVMANDQAITTAAACGNLELNAFLPLIADCLLESLTILIEGTRLLREKCVRLLTPDVERCRCHLDHSSVIITGLTPILGYDRAAAIVKKCDSDPEKIKAEILEQGLMEPEQLEELYQYHQASTYER